MLRSMRLPATPKLQYKCYRNVIESYDAVVLERPSPWHNFTISVKRFLNFGQVGVSIYEVHGICLTYSRGTVHLRIVKTSASFGGGSHGFLRSDFQVTLWRYHLVPKSSGNMCIARSPNSAPTEHVRNETPELIGNVYTNFGLDAILLKHPPDCPL